MILRQSLKACVTQRQTPRTQHSGSTAGWGKVTETLQGPWPLSQAWKEICNSPDILKINTSVWSPFTHSGDSTGVITWAWMWKTWRLSVNLWSSIQRESVTEATWDDSSPRYERAGRIGPHWDGHQLNIPVNSNEHTPNVIRWACAASSNVSPDSRQRDWKMQRGGRAHFQQEKEPLPRCSSKSPGCESEFIKF